MTNTQRFQTVSKKAASQSDFDANLRVRAYVRTADCDIALCLIKLPVTAQLQFADSENNANFVPRHLVILLVAVFPVRVSTYCRRNRCHRNRALII